MGVVLSFLPAITSQVKAVENFEVSINEWNYRFDRYSLDFNQSTYRTSWTHKELKERVPFYDEVLGAWPVSIRQKSIEIIGGHNQHSLKVGRALMMSTLIMI
jgi:hypothetical protein